MTLNEWQARLEGHFADLKRQRTRAGPSRTIYALEHGLVPAEVSDLENGIRTFICNSRPSDRHWLPWVVYSAEIGYEYAGDEYWETFAERTPGWIESGAQRSWIRSAYFQFHQEYGGTKPIGRWAEHFSIICWPITHAILPRDLQRQLAEILFDIRDLFTPELLHSPDLLGRQIEAHSWDASSRFCDLAEEHLLIGQIAAGLLLTDEEMETALVLPSTLKRIAGDLNQNRRSRDWLKDAQGRAATVRLRGLQRGAAEETAFADEDEPVTEPENRRTVVELGVEPDLLLRRAGAEIWDVRLRLPDLSGLLARFPEFKDVLANERCTVAGVKGAPLARGFFLHGTQEVSLATWPEASELLLKFEHSTPQLDFLLTTECLLRPGPRWLFKILADGSAAEIKSRVIQPGNSYIVLTRASSGSCTPPVESTQVATKCSGVSAVRMDVPDVVSHIYSEQIREFGLQAGSGLALKPVGLPAAKWDDQGYAEWLSGDTPTISVSSDFEMDGIALNLVGPCPAKLELPGSQLPSPILLELGRLESGRYKLHVIVSRPSENHKLVHGTLSFAVREAKPWKGARSVGSPFAVLVSPAKPHLEHLWDGCATVEINGPKWRKTDCDFQFYRDAGRADLIYTKKMPPIELPCTTAAWEAALSAASQDLKMQNAYDESVTCIVEWRCEELGQFVLCCERQPTPLRWVLKQENSAYFLRLAQLDDQEPVSISRYAYETPGQSSPVASTHNEAFRIPQEGGLYVAKTSGSCSAIVIPPHIRSLQQLGLRPQLLPVQRTEKDISDLLDLFELWESARVTGDLISRDKKRRVLNALENQLIGLLCGDLWARLERDLQNSQDRFFEIRSAITSNLRLAGIGKSLMDRTPELQVFSPADTIRYLGELARSYLDLPAFTVPGNRVARDQDWIVGFAYRLVSEPGQLRAWANADMMPGLQYVLRNHALLRIARFAKLLTSYSPAAVAVSAIAK